MTSAELRKIPEMVRNGLLSPKEGVNQIISFISLNYPIFGLHKYDEDFREEVYVAFLEKGEHFITHYDPVSSDFFTYLYCNILSIIHTKQKSMALHSVKEKLILSEGITQLDDIHTSYRNINFNNFEAPRVPYSFKPIKAEYLREIFSPVSDKNCDKKILILALKSCFYLTDDMITKVCSIYNIDKNNFYQCIQYCKDSIKNKAEKHEKLKERRNYAYYHHKKYESEIELLKNKDNGKSNPELELFFCKKNNKHFNNWQTLNYKLKNGLLVLRPTNKTISEVLGISERLVSYYITCAKNDSN